MLKTFGQIPLTLPKGYCKAIRYPVMMKMDQKTGDGRLFESAGGGVRDLPLSIMAQFVTEPGHYQACLSGTLFQVSLDPDTGLVEGYGFLLDDEYGRRYMRAVGLGALRGNSVDLADIAYRIEWHLDDYDYDIVFNKWNIAATTGVTTPAFAEAYAELDGDLSDDELVASLIGDDPMEPLVVEFAEEITANLILPKPMCDELDAIAELVASATTVPFAAFHVPESPKPQKIVIAADNKRVFGHLGMWNSCHDGVEGQCLTIPRPTDGYASFNKPGVLTDRGIVETGPIFAYGGHRKIGGKAAEDAYGGIENAWCDVRITEGVHGPWLSGVVRPGVPDDVIYAARASRISGHWVGGKLKAIVSVNAEGFEVPGTGDDLALDLAAGFAVHVDETGVCELVASFPACAESMDPDESISPVLSDEDRAKIVAEVAAILGAEPDEIVDVTDAVTLLTGRTAEEIAADDLALAELIAADDD